MPSRWKTSGLVGSRRARRRASASAMGCEIRENPAHQGLRARGREPDDAAGLVNFLPGEAEDLILAPAGVVGEVEDVLPRGGQVGADGEVFGVLEEALAGGILPQTVGEAGHSVEPAPVDGEGAHAVEGRGLAKEPPHARPRPRNPCASRPGASVRAAAGRPTTTALPIPPLGASAPGLPTGRLTRPAGSRRFKFQQLERQPPHARQCGLFPFRPVSRRCILVSVDVHPI